MRRQFRRPGQGGPVIEHKTVGQIGHPYPNHGQRHAPSLCLPRIDKNGVFGACLASQLAAEHNLAADRAARCNQRRLCTLLGSKFLGSRQRITYRLGFFRPRRQLRQEALPMSYDAYVIGAFAGSSASQKKRLRFIGFQLQCALNQLLGAA